MKRTLPLTVLLLLAALILVGRKEANRAQPVPLIPTITGQPEYCLTCHADLPEISPSHPVKAFGCVLCHGGERLALEPNLAHSTMHGGNNPSDLSVVEQSCGGEQCHSGNPADARNHIQRVQTSLQATYAGAIANMRYAFGAQTDLQAMMGIHAIEDLHTQTGITALAAFNAAAESNPALQNFGKNCLNCHLSATPLPGQNYARFTGCAACHTPLQRSPQTAGNTTVGQHTLTVSIGYAQCNTCHNRGNYDLRSMTFVPRSDQPLDRLHNYYQPIAQFTRCEWTLDCIDCHTRNETMGDGDIHANQADMQYIQCQTCHGTINQLPQTRTLTNEGNLAFRLARLNPVIDLKLGDTILVTQTGEALWNTRQLSDGTFELFGKASGQRFTFRPVKGSVCQQNPDQQESQYCHACHAEER